MLIMTGEEDFPIRPEILPTQVGYLATSYDFHHSILNCRNFVQKLHSNLGVAIFVAALSRLELSHRLRYLLFETPK